jgi:uncharacterized membrane protein (UPF0182 family)
MVSRPTPLPRLRSRSRWLIVGLVLFILFVIFVAVFTRLYTDLLFYRSVDASGVFGTVLWTKILLFVIAGLVVSVAVGANIVIAYMVRPPFRPLSLEQQNLERYRVGIEPYLLPLLIVISGLFGLLAAVSAIGRWKTWLLWRNSTSFGVKDPQFHRDISYYMFKYPFERMTLTFLFWTLFLSLIAAVATHYLFGGIRLQTQGDKAVPAAKAHISVLLGIFALLKAVAYYLDRFGLAFSERGKVTGASYTDVHAVLPAKLILLFISLLCAVLFIYNNFQRGWTLPITSFVILIVSALVIGGLYPAIVQQFKVRPNEPAREAEYIDRNITATTAAYDLPPQSDIVKYPASTTATAAQIRADTGTLPNARLLDPNLLSPTFDQLQQIRSYYGFPATLDIDRYTVKGETQDYVIAVRDIDQSGLSSDQRNWVNLHLAYTHGNGVVAAPANQVDSNGRPNFLLKGLPVQGTASIPIAQPRIYFGETSPSYSIVRTKQAEIDGPGAAGSSTDRQNYSYTGDGGVSIGSTFRKVLFALRFGEKNILLSSALTKDSRILYVRNPRERVQKVAPWLTLDGDPYPAVVNGSVEWIIDGYTTSAGYPYSQRETLGNVTSDAVTQSASNRSQQADKSVNYIRNSVKATVDAYTGKVTLYQFGDKDPLLETWRKAFPGTVKPESAISPELRAHLRYPEDLFKVQRDLIGRYHVTNSQNFYSGEDFWSASQQPDKPSQTQPPFYLYSQTPGEKQPDFNLTSAMINRKSSKLAAYISVSSDPRNYGRFQILQLPEGVTINGPTQVQAAIEANPTVSQELSLLRGQGSKTEGANLLTLPVAGGLLYIEPYYVTSTGAQGYPLLQRIAVVFGDKVGFADTLNKALVQVFGAGAVTSGVGAGGAPTTTPSGSTGTGGSGGTTVSPTLEEAIAAAQSAYDDGVKALAKSPPDFTAYGKAQIALQAALNAAADAAKATPSASPSASATPSATPKVTPTGTASSTAAPTPTPSK